MFETPLCKLNRREVEKQRRDREQFDVWGLIKEAKNEDER